MLNRSASLAMSTSVLKALPGKLDIKRHSPSILYVSIPDPCTLTYFGVHTGHFVCHLVGFANRTWWDAVIVLCCVVRYLVSILVLQLS